MHRYVGVLFALLAALHADIQVLASGNIGCLFSDTLCEQEREWCFDDHAFGHCLPHYGHIREEDLHRYDLGSEELRLLEQEMQRLFLLGYRWSHTYTQCVLQELLRAIRKKGKADFDISSCNGDVDQDLEGALRAIEGEELVDPRDLAIVRFTPSATDPHSDYADEVYFPPIKDQILQAHNPDNNDDEQDHHDDGGGGDDGSDHGNDNADGQTETDDHQESHTSEPGESVGRTDGGGVGVGGGGGGDGSEDIHGPPYHHSYYHPMGGAGSYPNPAPSNGHPMSDFSAGGMHHPSSPHDRPPLPPPYDPRQQNYIPIYGADDMEDYDDEVDSAPSYQSPYHYQTPLNPVYRKRSRPDDNQGPSLPYDKLTLAELKGIADLLRNYEDQNNYLGEAEERFMYPDGLQSKNEIDDESEGVFAESPARPMYSEAGLQFIPDIEDNGDLLENVAREAILSNMPQDMHVMPEEINNVPDHYRNMPGFLESLSPGNGRSYEGSFRNVPEALRNIPGGLDGLSGNTYGPMAAGEPQEYQGPESMPLENSITRSLFMPDSSPFELRKQDLPWERIMLDDFDDEEEDELENAIPRTDSKITALQEAFGPQLNSIRDFEDEGSEYNDDGYLDYGGGVRGEGGGVGGGGLLDDYGDDFDDMLQREWSFKRPERYDVKKPGPGFGVNSYSFDDESAPPPDGVDVDVGQINESPFNMADTKDSLLLSPQDVDVLGRSDYPVLKEMPDVVLAGNGIVDDATEDVGSDPKMEKLQDKKAELLMTSPAPAKEDPASQFEGPESYVYIAINTNFLSERDAQDLVTLITRSIGLTRDDIENIKVEDNQVTFQVKDNDKGITASDVAKKTKELRGKVLGEMGMGITKTGVGNKTTMSALVFSSSEKHILAAAAIVCGVMAALLVAASVLFFLRRHAKSKAKLLGLTAHDTEASKDYQELCRARMAGKGGAGESGKGDPPTTTHVPRISSLSKDSDNGNNSPSSRSSTSSCEEPVASNMDISTGHMVLSYMEDHLKNKDRLEQEWIALCAYEAEPCATTLAMKPENNKKNRYPDSVPYDHNRVVLNAHANVNGSDYINASSITDHDPRNPAYIATQGPLSTTAADFWQLVWEQGSVVIVMLTRLTENGLAFCHRYWPEEGSDLYHIYEVHLVSEHIWCDDYLVRSFYLKNVKTGETRTVTQFHFLSWPDSGTPASTKALLEFRRKVNKSYRGRSCPIIVHCSDGIGRTGTYCLIDMVLNRMAKGAKEIDIAATLEHIRDQRPHMVKSKGQFEFVLMAVAEEVHAILKALPQ